VFWTETLTLTVTQIVALTLTLTLTLTFDLNLQSSASHGHDPHTCSRSRSRVSSFESGNKQTDWADSIISDANAVSSDEKAKNNNQCSSEEMVSCNSPWNQSWSRKGVCGGKDLWNISIIVGTQMHAMVLQWVGCHYSPHSEDV